MSWALVVAWWGEILLPVIVLWAHHRWCWSLTYAGDHQLLVCWQTLQHIRVPFTWPPKIVFNSSFQSSHHHNTYPSYPISYPLCLKPAWWTRALETSLIWKLKIVLVLNLILVVQSKAPYYRYHQVWDALHLSAHPLRVGCVAATPILFPDSTQ